MEEPASGRVPRLLEVGGRRLNREARIGAPRRHRRRVLWPYLYVLPAVAAMAFAFGYPLVQVIRDSFYAGNFASPIWVGLDNYRGVIQDPAFHQSLENNLKLLLAVPVLLVLGLAVALVLNDRIRGGRQYQAIVFLPYVLPAAAIGIAFSFLLQQNGVLNTALRQAHLGPLAQDWLGSSRLAIVSVGGLVIWQQLGFAVVVFTAALLALPPETAEAARIDGAGWWSLQLRVLVPQIRPVIELVTVIMVITMLTWVFTYVYILTSGGPGYASSVMELYIWRSFLERGKRHRRERCRDAARNGECADRAFAVGAAEGGRRVRAGAGGRLVGLVGRHAFLIVICLAALYPLWFIVSTALKSNADYQLDPTGFPSHPTLDSLRTMVTDEPLPRWMWNSFLVTISSVAVSTLFALLAAYAAVFGRFRGHKIFLSTSVALMVVPPVTLLVPMFVFMVDTGWVNHLQSVIVFYTGLLVPFGVFFLASFFRTVPEELIEAASVEGAGPFTILRRVVLPLSGAAAFTLVVVQAIWVWNELLIALVFLQNDEARTLMSGLAQFQGRYATNQPLVLAGALISIAPIVLLYLSGQRFFVRGLTAGIGK